MNASLSHSAEESKLNEAMNRYAMGDSQAFGILHKALYPRLYAFLLRLGKSEAVADDLVQETFLRMHRARSTFASQAAVIPWAYTIARNVHIDHTRAQKHRKTERLPSDPGPESGYRVDQNAERAAMNAQSMQVISRVLARIPEAQRSAFVLIRYEGLSVEQAASVLGTSVSAVKLRAFRAYEAIREELSALGLVQENNSNNNNKNPSESGENARKAKP